MRFESAKSVVEEMAILIKSMDFEPNGGDFKDHFVQDSEKQTTNELQFWEQHHSSNVAYIRSLEWG